MPSTVNGLMNGDQRVVYHTTTRTRWQWEVGCISPESWDLPSLTSFRGTSNNFVYVGSVILESTDILTWLRRYPSIVIQWYSIWCVVFYGHILPSVIKYALMHILMIRCNWGLYLHHVQQHIRPFECARLGVINNIRVESTQWILQQCTDDFIHFD